MMFIDWNEMFLQRKTEEVKGNLVHPEASSRRGHKIEMLIVLHTCWVAPSAESRNVAELTVP